jgi:hypothetical protein
LRRIGKKNSAMKSCGAFREAYVQSGFGIHRRMKTKKYKVVEQPQPFTPGITRAMVRQHAYALYRDKLPNHPLTLEDWVLAEKDLVNELEEEQVEA